VAAKFATDAIYLVLFGARKSPIGGWSDDPFRCKRPWADAFYRQFIYPEVRLSHYSFIRSDQAFDRLEKL
jgi:hypothetical protein